MSVYDILKSEKTAWIMGGFIAVGVSAYAYAQVGWLGIGIIGLIGLVISMNISLQGGNAMSAGGGHGSGDVPLLARQLEESRRSQSSPEQKMAAEATRAKRARMLYLINAICIVMVLVGFELFSRFQF